MVRAYLLALAWACAAPSSHAADRCESATPLTLGFAVAGRTDLATPTAGIPAGHCGGARGNDEWFSFTAPAAGAYTFSLCTSDFDTVLSLWDGCPDGARTPLACNDDAQGCGFASRLLRTMRAGETLLVRVGGRDSFTGAFQLLVDAPMPPPPNDDCEDAAPLGLGSVVGSTTHATVDGASRCHGTAADVWYSFTAPSAGTFTFETCDALGYDTTLSLFERCGGVELACNDDSLCRINGNRASVSRAFRAGESVRVRVSGFIDLTGTFVLTAYAGGTPPPPPNDSCAGAVPIAEGQRQPFDTTYATTSGLRATGCGGAPITLLNDIFYAYTPECTGEATITTCSTSWDTVLAVYERCGGRIIACNDDDERFVCNASSGQSAVSFPVVAGRTYIVALGAYLVWRDGRGVISVACVPPPGCRADFNDDGFVDHHDVVAYLWCFGGIGCGGRSADVNGDRFVDFFDYDAFIEAFEAGC